MQRKLPDCCLRIRCRRNVFTVSLRSNERLFWLHYSGFRVSCHNIEGYNTWGYGIFGLCSSFGIQKNTNVSETGSVSVLGWGGGCGTNRVGVFHPLTWERKRIQCPKRCVLLNTRRWEKSTNSVIPSICWHYVAPTSYSGGLRVQISAQTWAVLTWFSSVFLVHLDKCWNTTLY
jgi:hypothetical protein